MNKFAANFILSFRVISDPRKYRSEIVKESTTQGIGLYYYFLFPLVLLASAFDAFQISYADGGKSGLYAFSISLLSWAVLLSIIIFGISYFLRRSKVYSIDFIYCLSFALIWLPIAEIVHFLLVSTLGIYGRFLGGWPVILGSIWLANFCIKEIIYESLTLEINKMRALFNRITVFIFVLVILIPLLAKMLIERMVLNVL